MDLMFLVLGIILLIKFKGYSIYLVWFCQVYIIWWRGGLFGNLINGLVKNIFNENMIIFKLRWG